ncbi:MAG: triose-phosphate isomerase [Candidatus Dormibacteria bacterium]
MYRGIEITPPFFELGPKGYMFGPEMLRVARCADELSREYQVQVIIDPQYVDIPVIAQQVQRALVFAPHMDSIAPGRGQGAVLPEAIKAAGATGVVLNHVEHRLSGDELTRTIRRADEVGLATMVCADDVEEAVSIAELAPNIIVVESPELIGTGSGGDRDNAAIAATDRAIWLVNPEIRVLHGAGIGSARDVFGVIAAGAQATGSSSAIFTAPDPEAVLGEMIKAVREAWEASH